MPRHSSTTGRILAHTKGKPDTRPGHHIESAKVDGELVIQPPRDFAKEDWATKVARAKAARRGGIAARKGKPATFPTTRFIPK